MALLPVKDTTDVSKKERAINITSSTTPSAQSLVQVLYIVPKNKMFTGYNYSSSNNLYINGAGKIPDNSKFYLSEGDTLMVSTAIAHALHITGVESEYNFK